LLQYQDIHPHLVLGLLIVTGVSRLHSVLGRHGMSVPSASAGVVVKPTPHPVNAGGRAKSTRADTAAGNEIKSTLFTSGRAAPSLAAGRRAGASD